MISQKTFKGNNNNKSYNLNNDHRKVKGRNEDFFRRKNRKTLNLIKEVNITSLENSDRINLAKQPNSESLNISMQHIDTNSTWHTSPAVLTKPKSNSNTPPPITKENLSFLFYILYSKIDTKTQVSDLGNTEHQENKPLNRDKIETSAEMVRFQNNFNAQVKKAADTPGLNKKNQNQQMIARAVVGLYSKASAEAENLNDLNHPVTHTAAEINENFKVATHEKLLPPARVTPNFVQSSNLVEHPSSQYHEVATEESRDEHSLEAHSNLGVSDSMQPYRTPNASTNQQFRHKRAIKDGGFQIETSDSLSENPPETTVATTTTTESSTPSALGITTTTESITPSALGITTTTESSTSSALGITTTTESSTSSTAGTTTTESIKKDKKYWDELKIFLGVNGLIDFEVVEGMLKLQNHNIRLKIEHEDRHLKELDREMLKVSSAMGGNFMSESRAKHDRRNHPIIKHHQANLAAHKKELKNNEEKTERLNSLVIPGNPNLKKAWKKKLEDYAISYNNMEKLQNDLQTFEKILDLEKEGFVAISQPSNPVPLYTTSNFEQVKYKKKIKLDELAVVIKKLDALDTEISANLRYFASSSEQVLPADNMQTDMEQILAEKMYDLEDQELDESLKMISIENLDNLVIQEAKNNGIQLTHKQLNILCTSKYATGYYIGIGTRQTSITKNFILKEVLLGEQYRYDTLLFPSKSLKSTRCSSELFSKEKSEFLNEFLKNKVKVQSIPDNIDKKTRETADELINNKEFIESYKNFVYGMILNNLISNPEIHINQNSIYEKIIRAFYNKVLTPEPVLFNGEIVPNIISIGVVNHRIIMSLNSNESYLYDPYVINDKLSNLIFKNLPIAEQAKFNPATVGAALTVEVAIVKGTAINLQKIKPATSLSFGCIDEINCYRDLFKSNIYKLLEYIDSMIYTSDEHMKKKFYDIRAGLLEALSILATLPIGSSAAVITRTIGTTMRLVTNIIIGVGIIINHNNAMEEADRIDEKLTYQRAANLQLIFTFCEIFIGGIDLKITPVEHIATQFQQVEKKMPTQWKNIPLALKFRGKESLAKFATETLKFEQGRFPKSLLRSNKDGLCHGLTLEAFQRMDRNPAGDNTLFSVAQSMSNDFNAESSIRNAFIENISRKQQAANHVAFNNLKKNPTKVFTPDVNISLQELKEMIREMKDTDVSSLRIYIANKNGGIDEVGHMIGLQKVNDLNYQIYDPNNGAFKYPNQELFEKTLMDYFASAYKDKGKLFPGALTTFSKVVAQGNN